MKDDCLLVFVKAPVPGQVKTRLAASIGPERACEMYIEMAQAVYRSVKSLDDVFTAVVYASSVKYPDLVWLDSSDPGYLEQRGEGLGERLSHGFDWAFRSGARRVCAIGVDSPGMNSKWILEAFDQLKAKDMAIGPTEDGGYYLIGLRRPQPELFRNIAWSTPEALAQTVEIAKRLKLSIHELPSYFDVDDEATLQRWLKDARKSSPWALKQE